MKMLLTEKKKPLKANKKPHAAKKEYMRIAAVAGILLGLLAVMLLPGCTGKNEPELGETGLIHEPEFGGVYITMTIDDFNALGFKYGDSVNVTFSNGYELKDLPYYNGF